MLLRSRFSIGCIWLILSLAAAGFSPLGVIAEPRVFSAEYLIFPFQSLRMSTVESSLELVRWDGAPSSINPSGGRTVSSDPINHVKVKSDCDALLRARGFGTGEAMHCEPNYAVNLTRTLNDPYLSNQSSMAQIDLEEDLRELPSPSSLVRVAVLDTGIDYEHPDLKNKMWRNSEEVPNNGLDDDGNGYIDDYHGIDSFNDDGDPKDDNGHGTHCAGVIGAEANNGIGIAGIAPGVELMALKFLGAGGSGSVFDSITAIRYAVDHGAQIINASFGSPIPSIALEDAMQQASARGVLVVAASGNLGKNNDSVPTYPSSYDLPSLVSVGAVMTDDRLAPFSNFGRNSVDLAAPGVQIFSTVAGGGYAALSGTSMAAPHVSGVAALLLGLYPRMSPSDIRSRLIATSRKVPSLSGLTVSSGIVSARNAVSGKEEIPTFDPTPVSSPFAVKITKIRSNVRSRSSLKRGSKIRFSVIGQPFQRVNLSFSLEANSQLVQCEPWRAILNKKGKRRFAARVPRNLSAQFLILNSLSGGNAQRREVRVGRFVKRNDLLSELLLEQNCMQLVEKVRIR